MEDISTVTGESQSWLIVAYVSPD